MNAVVVDESGSACVWAGYGQGHRVGPSCTLFILCDILCKRLKRS
jgi:hypothetical protein